MRKRPNAARDRRIRELITAGATYDEAASRFGISRQRVHQILDARRLPVAERRAAVEGDLAPYFAQPLEPRCARCGVPLGRRQTVFCEPCRRLVRTVRRVKALLRMAKRGQAQALRQAHYEIAKSGLQPDDLLEA